MLVYIITLLQNCVAGHGPNNANHIESNLQKAPAFLAENVPDDGKLH